MRRAARCVRLTPAKDFIFRGVMTYRIEYNYNAGHPERYTLLIECSVDDPLTVGRELPLPYIRELIADYESTIKTMPGVADTRGGWSGRKKDAVACIKLVSDMRFEKMKKGLL